MNNESRAQLIDRLVPGLAAFGGTSAWVENNGVRLHSLIFGNGPIDIVVLPGITRPAPTWAFVAKWLIDLARVVVLDVRGRGLSDAPPSGYQLADYVEDTRVLCDSLALDRPVILGHSMGARIGAVVSDIGGIMAHTAIVSREYGLPAVVGTGFATQMISTGQLIEVNGDDGIVRIITEGES